MKKEYSVLMSVYQKENPEYFRAALSSIFHQTVPPTEVVLVCDGPLTDALNKVVSEYESCYSKDTPRSTRTDMNDRVMPDGKRDMPGTVFRIVRLAENGGLGKALNEGLRHCSCEWIARMDTDDLAAPDRCERQLRYLERHPDVDALSGTIAEFQGDALDVQAAEKVVTSYKTVPQTPEEIFRYIKQRNPINHPCVMFKKSSVELSGGYQPCPYFEDYDLWVRMYRDHAVLANLPDTLLYMRVNGMHQRRGGIQYAKHIVEFRMKMYRYQVITFGEFLPMTVARVLVSLMPNGVRKYLYDKTLRKHK